MDGIPGDVASCSVSPSVLTECGSLNRGGSDKPLFVQFWGRVGRLTVCHSHGAGRQGHDCPHHGVALHCLQLHREPAPATWAGETSQLLGLDRATTSTH